MVEGEELVRKVFFSLRISEELIIFLGRGRRKWREEARQNDIVS